MDQWYPYQRFRHPNSTLSNHWIVAQAISFLPVVHVFSKPFTTLSLSMINDSGAGQAWKLRSL
jgi:hypothetical protein